MEKLKDIKAKEIALLLSETISLIKESLGSNPFIDLEKSLEIIKHRNYSEFPLIKKK